MIGYIITLVILLAFLGCGIYTIIKHPKKLKNPILWTIGITIFIMYLYPMIEVITNSSKGSTVYLEVLPRYNVIPFIFAIVLIASFLVNTKVGNVLFVVASLMIVPLFYSFCQIGIYHILNSVGFSERDALYMLGHIGIILYCVYLFRNKMMHFNLLNVIISILIVLGLYGIITGINVKFDTNYFGLTLNNNGYFLFKYKQASSTISTYLINFMFIFLPMILSGVIYIILDKKSKHNDKVDYE